MLDSSTGLKFCIRCEVSKPLSEFYRKHTTRDGLSQYCHDCHNTMIEPSRQANPTRSPKARLYENLVVEKLNSEGIYATSGNLRKDMAWVDIVAWGCIKIETRASILTDKGQYRWKVGIRGTQNWLQDNHFVILVAIEDQPRYFIFSPYHPAFYADGKLKTGIAYNPTPKYHKASNGLTNELMEYHENKWHWINDFVDLMRERKDFDMANTIYGAGDEHRKPIAIPPAFMGWNLRQKRD